MNANVQITIKDYSDTERIFIVKRESQNLFMDMGICQFNSEMEYWGMPTRLGIYNDEKGFVFSKNIEVEDIEMEIERFIVHNEI